MSIHSLHQFCSRQQARGFYHCPFPMDPMRFQGVEPRAFAGQGTPHNPDPVTFPFDVPVMLAEPLPHGVAAVPRGGVPHPQQGGFPHSGQLGADPAQEGARCLTPRPCDQEAQPHVLLAHARGGPLLDEQAITGQGFGVRISGRRGLLDEVQGLVRRGPGRQRGLRQATPPRLSFKAHRPLRMTRGYADQAVAGFFLRA